MTKPRDARTSTGSNALVDYLVSVNPLALRGHVEDALGLGGPAPVVETPEVRSLEARKQDLRDLVGDDDAWIEDHGCGILSVSVARPDPSRAWEGMSPTRH